MDNLLGVTPKVRHRVEDRLQSIHVEALDAVFSQKVMGRRFLESVVSLGDDFIEAANQFRRREWPALRKLFRALTHILFAANARHDPLPQIAAQMHDKVAHAVHGL